MRLLLSLFVILLLALPTFAADAPTTAPIQPAQTFPLWPDAPPGAKGTDPVKDIPTLSVYPADPGHATGALMVICPGGSYARLADHEGRDYGVFLAEHGITGLVLKYRLGSNGYHHPVMLHDVQRAIRLARSRCAEWNGKPDQIGVMGSSAGGHLAASAVTLFDAGNPDAPDPIDRLSSRPDFGVICYAVITMTPPFVHAGSRNNLLGNDPPQDLIDLLSPEKHVTKDTPPCFLWTTTDDRVVNAQNTLLFASALQQNKIPYDLHVYQHGPHGQGLGVRGYHPGITPPTALLPWTQDLIRWLSSPHVFPAPTTMATTAPTR